MLALQREQFVDGMDLRELAMSLEIDRSDILALSKLVENSGVYPRLILAAGSFCLC